MRGCYQRNYIGFSNSSSYAGLSKTTPGSFSNQSKWWSMLIMLAKKNKQGAASVFCRNTFHFLFFLVFFICLLMILAGWIDNSVYPKMLTLRSLEFRSSSSSPSSCPSYFRWIHEDLQPWKQTGVTREMLEKARRTAHFRLVILNGRAYVEKYKTSIQTRDVFTLWGILQLLQRYPGRLPDLELMFDCDDRPVINSRAGPPAPLFRYCSDLWSLDIVFPDWSFWGWAETNIKPWIKALGAMKEGNKKIKWEKRVPYAYWKGNPNVCPSRGDLIRCNVSEKADWNARLYIQDWDKEVKEGFKQSNLEDQCTHRYRIYIDGWAWSVSKKYIMACDSMTLMVRPGFHDFFSRGLIPLKHYWPVKENDKCRSLKFAVHWANDHLLQARVIGQAGSRFIHEDLKMEFVYDYMFHLLNQYAKLIRFKPQVSQSAVELSLETVMAYGRQGEAGKLRKRFMVESHEEKNQASSVPPCSLPPPYEPKALQDFINKKANLTSMVERWEDEYWAQFSIRSSNATSNRKQS